MAKPKTIYTCTECGGSSPKWQGQCPQCGTWNTLVETVATPAAVRFATVSGTRSAIVSLSAVETRNTPRIPTGLEEFDRVLGGGLVPGGVVLIGGDPGIGKSTLLLQAGAALGAAHRTLYITGEESVEQVALRAQRLGLVNAPGRIAGRSAARGDRRRRSMRRGPEVVVIDSIQTVYTEALQSAPGSVAQVRECAAQLTRLAKQRGVVVIFVGHVTKEGAIAGPRVLEHIVDAVLYFEGDPHSSFRLVRAIKNRFGAANELGVFAMTERGLKGVANPSALFLSQHAEAVAGFGDRRDAGRVAAVAGGDPGAGRSGAGRHAAAAGGGARRAATGACCWRSCIGMAASTPAATTYSSTPSGVCASRNRPSTWPCCSPSIHHLKTKPLPAKSIVFGEVGLAGEIRPVQRGQERIREAAKLGFKTVLIPTANKPKQGVDGIKILPVDRVDQALALLRE